ncbi:MAG: alpha/beta-hydrolase family protein [Rhodobacteraceae bacterium]|nr:alpha/beta-hydrolase family protein [Paracoccaceae bacterium]
MKGTGIGLNSIGMIVGAAFFCAALTPSLIPRDPMMQGVLCGIVAIIGYWLGSLGLFFWKFLGLPRPPQDRQALLRWVVFAASIITITLCLWQAAGWQNITRDVMGLEPVESSFPLTIAGVGGAIFLVLMLVGRALGFSLRRLERWLDRILPPRVGFAVGILVVGYVFWTLVNGTLIQSVLTAADESFEIADLTIEPQYPQPTDPTKAGSAESLITWETMGRRGREFVSIGATQEEIAEFHGEDAMEPLRVYVGRITAEDEQTRADLALAELIRVGGFERSNLVVVVPVGTGWMDPGGHDTLEFILGGDVATVAVQYSYLTSALSLMTHPEYGVEQARVLFDTVYDYWKTLPEETRPKFYLHGLSQGSFNSQSTFRILDVLGDPIDGALWAGSPFLSTLWQGVRDGRNDGSPAWRPQFGNGSLVRVLNQEGFADVSYEPWGPMRFVFLHYASDPIVAFTFSSGFRRPDWMKGERPFDVSPQLRWYPVVTMFQNALDMAISLQIPRFGHFYVYQDYIHGWAAVLDPPGWSPERADELTAIFDERPAPW